MKTSSRPPLARTVAEDAETFPDAATALRLAVECAISDEEELRDLPKESHTGVRHASEHDRLLRAFRRALGNDLRPPPSSLPVPPVLVRRRISSGPPIPREEHGDDDVVLARIRVSK